jgi:hypothetical protein
MREIYDDQKCKGKDRSNSKNSKNRKNEYSSTESYENIISHNKKLTEVYSVSAKNNKKLSDVGKNIRLEEVSFSQKKPNFQNKLLMKYNENSSK